ncbi:hypothetical protein CIB48_g4026 [Xylaria polymorpha]|nr:hypothetical protein CIB48_g4026 [Xylaria polymorpha]
MDPVTMITIILSPVLAYIVWTIVCLELNVRKARALDAPYIRLPIDSNNVPWTIFQPSDTHVRLGPVWALVTPVAVYLHFADPDAINEIFTRRADFVRLFKEYSNRAYSMQRDTRTLSLNVLASTGFSKSYEFRRSTEPAIDEAGNYRDSLQTVLDNVIPLMLIPYRVLANPLLPKSWVGVGNAAAAFKQHMAKMLSRNSGSWRAGRARGGIVTAFVHALERNDQDMNSPEASAKRGLFVDEIFGDLFVINFAGHDTTADKYLGVQYGTPSYKSSGRRMDIRRDFGNNGRHTHWRMGLQIPFPFPCAEPLSRCSSRNFAIVSSRHGSA